MTQELETSRKIVPLLEPGGKRHQNFIYSPWSFVKETVGYKIIMAVAELISATHIIFFRHRIGLRSLPAWAMIVFFLLFLWINISGSILNLLRGSLSFDWWFLLYTLLMGLLAFYHIQVGYELGEQQSTTVEGLHTVSRGDSHLVGLMQFIPPLKITLPVFSQLPKKWATKELKAIHFDEPIVQRWVEPFALLALSVFFGFHSWFLATWCYIGGIMLALVETDISHKAFHTYWDEKDTMGEAYTQRKWRIISENQQQHRLKPNQKIGGISQFNCELMARREERIRKQERQAIRDDEKRIARVMVTTLQEQNRIQAAKEQARLKAEQAEQREKEEQERLEAEQTPSAEQDT